MEGLSSSRIEQRDAGSILVQPFFRGSRLARSVERGRPANIALIGVSGADTKSPDRRRLLLDRTLLFHSELRGERNREVCRARRVKILVPGCLRLPVELGNPLASDAGITALPHDPFPGDQGPGGHNMRGEPYAYILDGLQIPRTEWMAHPDAGGSGILLTWAIYSVGPDRPRAEVKANSNANAYVGTLGFTTTGN